MKQSRSIFFQILTIIIAIIFIIIIFFSVLMSTLFQKNTSDLVIQSNDHSVSQLNSSFDVFYQQLIYIIVQVMSDSNAKTYLTRTPEDNFEYYQMEQQATAYLRTFSGFFSYFDINIVLQGTNGLTYSTYEEEVHLMDSGIFEEDFYRQAYDSRRMLGINYSRPGITPSTLTSNYIFVAKPLFEAHREKSYGTIFLIIDESCLSSLYHDLQQEDNYFSILTNDGLVISDTEQERLGTEEQELLAQVSGDIPDHSIVYQGNRYILVSEYNNFFNFWIVQRTRYSLISELVYPALFTTILYSSIVFVFSIFIVFLLVKRITNPLQTLTSVMQGVTKEQTHIKPDKLVLHGCRESELLGDAFNVMFDELHLYIDRLLAEQDARHHAELNALQRQITPHFIYNTLASIKYLTLSGNNEAAVSGINSIIKILRKTIGDTSEMIPLREELELLEHYFTIKQLRYGSDIRLTIRVDEACMELSVMKLLLQPLVENAIFHGFSNKTPKGNISVYATVNQGILQIEVIDNGMGISPQRQVEIMQEDQCNPNKKRLSGIGIKNIDERIKLIYGAQYGLQISSEPNVGTQITIELPATPATGGNKACSN